MTTLSLTDKKPTLAVSDKMVKDILPLNLHLLVIIQDIMASMALFCMHLGKKC